MADSRLVKMAEVLVHYSMDLHPGDRVAIQGTLLAEPLVREVYKAALQAGALPAIILSMPDQAELFFRFAGDQALTDIPPIDRMINETFEARLAIMSEANTKSLSNIDPEKQKKRQTSMLPLLQTVMSRQDYKWCGTLFPTNAYAQDAGMSLDEFEDFVYHACKLDDPDPVARWKELGARQERWVEWLKPKREIHLVGPETDLRLGIAGRTFISDEGKKNFPGGEIFTGPVENEVNGKIYFSLPASVQGREVRGIRLTFRDGRVVDASAEQNQEFLFKMLDADPGARTLGELGIGTNMEIQRATKNVLFDEKIGGTAHLAIGASYPETGGVNQSAVHWDMVCDLRQGGAIYADGELFCKDGRFVVE